MLVSASRENQSQTRRQDAGATRGLQRRRNDATLRLSHPVTPPPKKLNQSLVPQHLKLLPNLVPHMPVLRMQSRELAFLRVNILKIELRPLQSAHNSEHIKRPPAFFNAQLGQRTNAPKTPAHFRRSHRNTVRDNPNTSIVWNVRQNDIAAHPTRAPRGSTKGLASLDRRLRNRKARYQQQIAHSPRIQSVMEQNKMRSAVGSDCLYHLRVSRVQNSIAERF
jgi:hypothetical protein